MNFRFLISAIALFLVAGCSDGIPVVEDPNNIVVNGEKFTKTEFLEKYCAGKSDNASCMKVLTSKRQDSTRGKMPSW